MGKLIALTEWAKKHGISDSTARQRAGRGAFDTAQKIGGDWVIDSDEELKDCDSIKLIDPIDVIDCHNFEARSYLCLTDSGGIQEECPHFGVPVLVMRDTTERPEGIASGSLKLVGTSEELIYNTFKQLLEDKVFYETMSSACNPYGDGHASERIADILETGSYNPWKPK